MTKPISSKKIRKQQLVKTTTVPIKNKKKKCMSFQETIQNIQELNKKIRRKRNRIPKNPKHVSTNSYKQYKKLCKELEKLYKELDENEINLEYLEILEKSKHKHIPCKYHLKESVCSPNKEF